MSLTLAIANVATLDNGQPTRVTLDRHGAIIGRSPHVDWSLPDPQHYISSTHCEIDYRDGAYTLTDKSTNGTFVNGGQGRLAAPHRIRDGDVIAIGHYQITAKLEGADLTEASRGAQSAPAWSGWDAQAPAATSPVDPASGWDRPSPQPAISGLGPMSEHWAPPSVQPASLWQTPAPAPTPASAWSSPIAAKLEPPSASDVWGQLAATNAVDWGRGGFGSDAQSSAEIAGLGLGSAQLGPQETGALQALGLSREPSAAELPASGWGAPARAALAPSAPPPPSWRASETPPSSGWGVTVASSPPAGATVPPPGPAQAYAPAQSGGGEWAAFLAGAGLGGSELKSSPSETLSAAGLMLKRLIAGLVVMLEARARAKAQLGAQGTSLELHGNNPLKFARTPENALAQLLNPQERGFMTAERAVQDAFQDLQAHQVATLAAMQGALAATLKRFSPESIRAHAERRGILAKILPTARDAALWQDYEREFEGVAKGSDEAFMDVFAKEFRQAYEAAAAQTKAQR